MNTLFVQKEYSKLRSRVPRARYTEKNIVLLSNISKVLHKELLIMLNKRYSLIL